MPEHREGTPEELRDLESFLWWDFNELAIWQAWIVKRGWSGEGADRNYEDALGVQQALRTLEAMNNGMASVPAEAQRINSAIEQHALMPRLSIETGLTIRQSDAPDPVGHILALAVNAMISRVWTRFKLCRDEGCRASYFDATRNGAKKWCSMKTCGSRNKMRRFRAKAG